MNNWLQVHETIQQERKQQAKQNRLIRAAKNGKRETSSRPLRTALQTVAGAVIKA